MIKTVQIGSDDVPVFVPNSFKTEQLTHSLGSTGFSITFRNDLKVNSNWITTQIFHVLWVHSCGTAHLTVFYNTIQMSTQAQQVSLPESATDSLSWFVPSHSVKRTERCMFLYVTVKREHKIIGRSDRDMMRSGHDTIQTQTCITRVSTNNVLWPDMTWQGSSVSVISEDKSQSEYICCLIYSCAKHRFEQMRFCSGRGYPVQHDKNSTKLFCACHAVALRLVRT